MGVDSWPGGPTVHGHGNGNGDGRGRSIGDAPISRTGAAPRHRVRRVEAQTRRVGGPLGDRRGLTAAGAMVLLLLLGGVGATFDRLLGHGLWAFFSVAFVAAVLLTASRVHIEDLAASIVIVPWAYAVIGMATSLVADLGSGQPLKVRLASAFGVLVLSAPVLVLSVVVAAAIALARGRAVTLARRRARARATRRFGSMPPGSRPPARSNGRVAAKRTAPPSGDVRR